MSMCAHSTGSPSAFRRRSFSATRSTVDVWVLEARLACGTAKRTASAASRLCRTSLACSASPVKAHSTHVQSKPKVLRRWDRRAAHTLPGCAYDTVISSPAAISCTACTVCFVRALLQEMWELGAHAWLILQACANTEPSLLPSECSMVWYLLEGSSAGLGCE